MMQSHLYLANLLGAVSLGVSDRVSDAANASLGLGGQTAPALVLIAMSPRITIKRLAERLRLSHPGAVRLIDRLETAMLVSRLSSEDRREVRLVLTRKGAGEHQRLRKSRQEQLSGAIDALSPAQRAALEPALKALVAHLAVDAVSAWSNCRLCDAETCAAQGCPAAAWDRTDEA